MNKKMIGAVLGTLAFVSANVVRADDKPAGDAPKAEKPAKKSKKKADKAKDEGKGGDAKSCKGADGKGCSGAK